MYIFIHYFNNIYNLHYIQRRLEFSSVDAHGNCHCYPNISSVSNLCRLAAAGMRMLQCPCRCGIRGALVRTRALPPMIFPDETPMGFPHRLVRFRRVTSESRAGQVSTSPRLTQTWSFLPFRERSFQIL